MPAVNHKLVEIALAHVPTGEFEKFVNTFLAPILGPDFIPMGGVHDGGADAFRDLGLYETRRPGTFYQTSIQENHKAKITHTVKRLREVGRDPKTLIYVTAQFVKLLDQDELSLSNDTDVFVRIRDAGWITGNINHSPATIAAFESYLRPHLSFLGTIGGATVVEHSRHLDSRAICVFLGQETERRSSNSTLIESVSDSLILWALEGTDPERPLFATRDQIIRKVVDILPSARYFIRPQLNGRLEILSSKGNPTGREIRWYKKEDKFCLPYETRLLVQQENIEDELLKVQVLKEFEARAQSFTPEVCPRTVARVALRAVELTFEARGLELATFLERDVGDYEDLSISDQVDIAIQDASLGGMDAVVAKESTLSVIRRSFYDSTRCERTYFGKLARSYSLLFCLRAEPRIVEYFQSMSGSLILLVGTDILIRALSERYLRAEDQMTCNMLNLLRDVKADLVLTEPVVEEIYTHLRNTDLEFQLDFKEVEQYVDAEIARHSSKILIRAYFYARLHPVEGVSPPTGWGNFVGQVCDYGRLRTNMGREQIRKYLSERFGMKCVLTADLEEVVSGEEVQMLTEVLKELRPNTRRELIENDAKMALAVYGKRESLKEQNKTNPYGYRTWWLTQESIVRKATVALVEKRGAQYIMRPEFLLNFIALSPTMSEVRSAYKDVFPTLLGVKLGNRMRPDLFHGIMEKAREAMGVDDARARVMMEDYSNKLKGDFFKQRPNMKLNLKNKRAMQRPHRSRMDCPSQAGRSPSPSTSDTVAQPASRYPPRIGAITPSSETTTARAASSSALRLWARSARSRPCEGDDEAPRRRRHRGRSSAKRHSHRLVLTTATPSSVIRS